MSIIRHILLFLLLLTCQTTFAQKSGKTYTVSISYVGFEPIKTQVKVNKDTQLRFAMNETSLALQEVSVVAKQNASGTSTSSIISRQAIDHLQGVRLSQPQKGLNIINGKKIVVK